MNNSDQSFSRFLSYVSHEVRSPVSSMMTLCELLELGVYGELNTRQQQAMQDLQDCGHTLLNLLSDVIDLAKANQGKLIFNPEMIILADFLKEIEHLTHEIRLKKQQNLKKHIDAAITQFIADRKRLKQIILFMLEQSILHSAPNTELQFDITCQPQQLVFTLHSTSLQFDVTQATDNPLNFPFVQQLAELQAGHFAYQIFDETAAFRLSLPWQVAQTTAEKTASPPLVVSYANQEKLILLADHDPMQLHTLVDFLVAQGYRVKTMNNGAEVVQLALNTQPHLIIMDVELLDLDGFAATRQIKASQETQAIPVLLCAIENDENLRQKAMQAGAVALWHKPFSLAALQTVL